jgi:hypothetical protein
VWPDRPDVIGLQPAQPPSIPDFDFMDRVASLLDQYPGPVKLPMSAGRKVSTVMADRLGALLTSWRRS